MGSLNDNVPLLGPKPAKMRAMPPMFVSLVRALDDNGTFEPEDVILVNGQPQAIAGRSNIVSAEDLVDMFGDMVRKIIREEFKLLKIKAE